ncbi:MAG: glucose-6-phosphate isomerase [Gemmatimonadota bacterium]
MTRITLDPSNLLDSRLGSPGIEARRLTGDLADRFRAAHAEAEARRESGEAGFFALPYAQEAMEGVREVADSFGQWFEALVVVGIGGSSLGARAIADALLKPYWNELSPEEREHFPRLYFLENVDPGTTKALLGRLDLRKTLFNVVSKSGSTAETMAQYLVVEEALRAVLDEATLPGHLLFTTDPVSGALRKLAGERGIPALEVPANVGGRFSVLSAVGLLPAGVVGVDLAELLAGAAAMDERCRTNVLEENPAGLFATLLHAAHAESGRSIHVFMPYGDRLRTLGLWFQQLWAESLGKARDRKGNPVHVGPTPVAALGAVDQHSLLQLLMEGPQDKVVCFLRVEERDSPVEIPRSHPEVGAFSYLGGHTLDELLETERQATAEALRRAGRPSLAISVQRLDARGLGGLIMLFQIATAYAGELYGVDPFDQPGVELGKVLTYGMLGREGYPLSPPGSEP